MADEYKFVITGKDATKRAFSAIRKNLGGVRSAINSTQVKVAGLAGVAGLGMMISKSLASGDALGKFADRVGATTEGLAGLQLITELNGESSESLSKSLEKMNRGIGEAGRGIGTAKPALESLGLSLDQLSKLPADEKFIKIGAAIGDIKDPALQASLASDIFGRSGVKLINTFNQGEEAMRGAAQQAQDLGIAMSRTDAAKLEAANDAMLLATKRTEGLGNQLTIAVAPIIAELAEQFSSTGLASDDMAKVITSGLKGVTGTVGVVADGIHGVGVVIKGIEVIARGFAAAFIGAVHLVQEVVFGFANTIKHGLILPFKGWLEIAALVPGITTEANAALDSLNKTLSNDWKPPTAVGDTFWQLTEGMTAARSELHQMMLEDLPSAVIDARLEKVLAGAQAKAEAIAAKAGSRLEQSTGDSESEGLEGKEREKAQMRLDRLNEGYQTELEQLQVKLQTEQMILTESLQNNLLTEDRFKALSIRAEQKYQTAKGKIEGASAADRKTKLFGSLTQIAGMVGGQSKKMFKVQKAMALAEAVVTLPPAIIKSFNNSGGFPFGIPAAAAMAAAGIAQIATIKSSSFGGGGSVTKPSGGGGSFSGSSIGSAGASLVAGIGGLNAANDSSEKSGAKEVHFHFPDGLVIGSNAEQNLSDMRRLIVEQDFQLIPPNSRNGIDLAAGVA